MSDVSSLVIAYMAVGAVISFALAVSGWGKCGDIPASRIGLLWPLFLAFALLAAIIIGVVLVIELPAKCGLYLRGLMRNSHEQP